MSAQVETASVSHLAVAEAALLSADLDAKRRVVRGELSREEYAAMRPHFAALFAHLNLLRVAADPPHVLELPAWGPP